jgi:hypothetical protein
MIYEAGFSKPKYLGSRECGSNSTHSISAGRKYLSCITGTKDVSHWLLVSEKGASSTAHFDVAFATCFGCDAELKTI